MSANVILQTEHQHDTVRGNHSGLICSFFIRTVAGEQTYTCAHTHTHTQLHTFCARASLNVDFSHYNLLRFSTTGLNEAGQSSLTLTGTQLGQLQRPSLVTGVTYHLMVSIYATVWPSEVSLFTHYHQNQLRGVNQCWNHDSMILLSCRSEDIPLPKNVGWIKCRLFHWVGELLSYFSHWKKTVLLNQSQPGKPQRSTLRPLLLFSFLIRQESVSFNL